jgi:hypothetical protein
MITFMVPAHRLVEGSCEHGNEHLGYIEYLFNWQLLKKGFSFMELG